jgi:hypothetical protein
MISCAWVFRSIGKVSPNSSSSRSQPQTICGLRDEVAQVSITSGSAVKPPGWPRCASVNPGGRSELGSIGNRSSLARMGWA